MERRVFLDAHAWDGVGRLEVETEPQSSLPGPNARDASAPNAPLTWTLGESGDARAATGHQLLQVPLKSRLRQRLGSALLLLAGCGPAILMLENGRLILLADGAHEGTFMSAA